MQGGDEVELVKDAVVSRGIAASVSGLIEPDFGSRKGATSRDERIKVTITVQVTERDDDPSATLPCHVLTAIGKFAVSVVQP